MANQESPQLPIAISSIEDRYLIFDIDAIRWLRRSHNICGVYIGSLPQNPSQSVFMGIPMEIMPEEAQLLIEQGVAFLLNDARAHDIAVAEANRMKQREYVDVISIHVAQVADEHARERDLVKQNALKKVRAKMRTQTPDQLDEDAGPLFDGPETASVMAPKRTLSVTPTSSQGLLDSLAVSQPKQGLLPGLTQASYNLYKHLHCRPNKTYFMTPGLRFGCQFCVYPGDPLRFHSHFLAVGYDWDEQIDLMDIVGGGRLGTGVKKGFVFGGKDDAHDEMKVFSVEWAAM